MSRKTRYAVDTSLFNRPDPQPTFDQGQQSYANQQSGYPVQQAPPPQPVDQGAYASTKPHERSWAGELPSAPAPAGPPAQPSFGYEEEVLNHIPQPPHSAGPSLRGPKPRISPQQVPSPIEAAELDQNLYDGEDFLSCDTKGLIPLAGTDYRGIDQGNSLPRFIRSTLTHIPATSSLLDTSQLPLGVVLHPFALPRYDEEPIPVIPTFANPGEVDAEGPPRCSKCRGYINPWCRWVDGGQKWGCNLCGNFTSVPANYFSNLDSMGVRLDIQNRPELRYGTVDFLVPPSYYAMNPASLLDSAGLSSTGDLLSSLNTAVAAAATSNAPHQPTEKELKQKQKERAKEDEKLRQPMPIGRVFAIDVSWSAAKGGLIRECCEGIRLALYGERREGEEQNGEEPEEFEMPPGRVGIVTFDSSVQFYNLNQSTFEKPQMMVVSDLDDMFIPLTDGFLVDPLASRTQIETLLALLPSMYADNQIGDSAVGAVAKGVLAGLINQGGQLTIFMSSLPNAGPGKLRAREDPLIYGTDKEKTLYGPGDPFWRNTAEELAEAGVGVNVFFFPERYIDVASVGVLASITGGDLFFHPRFDPVRDRGRVHEEIRRIMAPDLAYNVTVRIRCSNGLRIGHYSGNFHQRSLTDLEFGTLASDKSFTAIIKHEAKLDDRQTAFFQAAALYTTATGERRVRCMNISMPVTSHIGNVFRFADFDSSVLVYLKEAMTQGTQKNLFEIRKALTEKCVKVLLMYRRHCAAATQPGQLILPEVFKLLPLFTLCIIKSKAIKGGNVSSDVRSLYMRTLRSVSLQGAMTLLYPRMIALHDLPEHIGFPAANGRLNLPTFMRASHTHMVADGAYLLATGEVAIIWLGSAVSPQILYDLYGVDSLEEIDHRMTALPRLPTLLSTQIRNIMSHYERLLGHSLPVIIARQNMDGTEIEFANALVEDANNDALSYTDYLMSVHKSITEELNGSSKSGEGWKAPWSS